jgi:NADH-quinone oxidoreductase subunit A
MLSNYGPVLILILLASGLAALILGLAAVMGPRGLNRGARDTYESGVIPAESARQRFPVRFALIAMLFLVFDIEAIFFYPWAVTFRRLGLFGLVEMLLFIGLLFVGYVYAYKKGALNWE